MIKTGVLNLSNSTVTDELYAECYNEYRSGIDEQASSILKMMSTYIGNLENISVLDVGSGPGRLAIPIGQVVQRVVCVEPDIVTAKYLKSRSENSKIPIEVHIAKIQDLSNQNLGYFELVILSHIIHWFEPSSPFGLSTNFVKNGGYILLSFFDPDQLKNMLFYKISGKEIFEIQKNDTPSKLSIELMLIQQGFEVVESANVSLNVFYGNDKLKHIINSSGTLAWQKLKEKVPEEKYRQIESQALTRLENESCLTDTEFRTMILAKKGTS